MVYVLLDGVGDLPHPDLKNTTPLDYAKTPNLDKMTKNGAMGEVISVGKELPQNPTLQSLTCLATSSSTLNMQEGA